MSPLTLTPCALSYAEMPKAQKNTISHRGRALELVKKHFAEMQYEFVTEEEEKREERKEGELAEEVNGKPEEEVKEVVGEGKAARAREEAAEVPLAPEEPSPKRAKKG